VRPVKVVVAVLVILVIASAARSRSHDADAHADPAAALNVRTRVPEPVMSTVRRACFDCHSNETRWPWYSALPLASWLIERDVTEGRGQINFSRWAQYNPFDRADMLDKVCDVATNRKMPPLSYRMLHSEARLSETDIAALCGWSRREATRLVEGGS
jgi:Haem-binding domain